MQNRRREEPPLEHVFGRLLRYLTHNHRRSRVERRSTRYQAVLPAAQPKPQCVRASIGLVSESAIHFQLIKHRFKPRLQTFASCFEVGQAQPSPN